MKLRLIPAAVIFIALFSQLSAIAQTPSGRDVVAVEVSSFDKVVVRNGSFQLAVILKIRPGFHINARKVSADYLIPTDVRAEISNGFTVDEISYPKGTLRTFSFSKKPLNVYEGTTIVRMKLTTTADTPLGQRQIPLKVRYQACNNEICLPPVTLDAQGKIAVEADLF